MALGCERLGVKVLNPAEHSVPKVSIIKAIEAWLANSNAMTVTIDDKPPKIPIRKGAIVSKASAP